LKRNRSQEENLTPHKIFQKLEEIFSKIKTKSTRDLISADQLVNDYPLLVPSDCENANQYFLEIMKGFHSIYFECGKKGFKITSIHQRIVRRIEDIMIHSDKTFYPLNQMLKDDAILQSIVDKQEDIFESFQKVSSEQTFIDFNNPISIGLHTNEELVAKQVDYLFSDEFLENDKGLQQSMKKNNGSVQISILIVFKQINALMKNIATKEDKLDYLIECIRKHSKNAIIENNEKTVRPLNTEEKILVKMNEIFSDKIYSTNSFLKELASHDDEGFIDLEILFKEPELKKLSSKIDEVKIHETLSKSQIFSVDKTGKRVKKNFFKSKLSISQDVEFLEKINFIFGDANYPFDLELIKKAQERNGFVPIEDVIKDYNIQYENKSVKELCEILSKSKVVKCHFEFPWIQRRHKIDSRKVILSGVNANTFKFNHINEDKCFTVMQYNILADYLCHFDYAAPQSKLWENRRIIISKEIKFYMPDLFCLEEVQTPKYEKRKSMSHPDDHYLWLLGEFPEYRSVYKRKTGSKKGADLGNAIFWKDDVFKKLNQYDIEFIKEISKESTDEETKKILANYPQVAIIVHLLHIPSNQELLVCCIHTSSHYQFPHIAACQVQCCLNQFQEIMENEKKRIPVVFCGDFNSTPQSEVYSLLCNGKLKDEEFVHLYDTADQEKFEIPFKFSHNLNLSSSYYNVNYEEPEMTHVVETFNATLDYIWFSTDSLKTIAVLETPKESQLKKEIGLPNSRFPSDHIPLLSKFQFK
jgi:mRNA deadenylase 3'-5' endonuclease subunit Ccr4